MEHMHGPCSRRGTVLNTETHMPLRAVARPQLRLGPQLHRSRDHTGLLGVGLPGRGGRWRGEVSGHFRESKHL